MAIMRRGIRRALDQFNFPIPSSLAESINKYWHRPTIYAKYTINDDAQSNALQQLKIAPPETR